VKRGDVPALWKTRGNGCCNAGASSGGRWATRACEGTTISQPDLQDRALDLAAGELADRGRELAELAKADDHLGALLDKVSGAE
jgi:hypothetical protein